MNINIEAEEYLPLIEFEDVYLDYDPVSDYPFTLNIIMPKGEKDVLDIVYE